MKNGITARIISASAGTGKTFRLSIEYIKTLLNQPEPRNPEFFTEIVVLTFTKKATAEIAERIVLHLKNIIEDPEGKGSDIIAQFSDFNRKDHDFLQKVYYNIVTNKHKFRIQTIDSFFGTLFQSIVTPQFHIDDYEIVHEQKPEIYNLILEKLINENNFHHIVKKYIHKGKEISKYESLIKGLISNRWIIENTDIDVFGDREHLKGFIKETLQIYKLKFVNQLKSYVRENNIELKSVFMSTFPFNSIIEQNGINKDNVDELLPGFMTDVELRLNCAKLKPEKIFKKKYRDYFEKENQEAYNYLVSAILFDVFIDQQILVETGKKVFELYDEIVKTVKSFTHDDILYYTLSVMKSSESLISTNNNVTNQFYELLSQRISFLLIDEFQDTNVNQWDLIRPVISELISGSGIKNYSGFIIVGDEKQAIYGWRGGESKLLSSISRMFPESGDIIQLDELTTSYRSSSSVIDYVNMLFSSDNGLSAYISKANIEWEYPQVNYLNNAPEGFVKVKFESYAQKQKDLLYQRFVAFFKSYWEEHDIIKEGRTAIIARKNKDLAEIAQLLGQYKIPFQLSSSGSIIKHNAIIQIIGVMKYLAFHNFTDLLAVLRSDLIKLGSDDFYRLCEFFRKESHSSDVQIDFSFHMQCLLESGIEKCAITRDRLCRISEKKYLSEKINGIVDLFGFSRLFKSDNDAGAIIAFLNAAREYEAVNSSSSLQDFLSYIYDNENENIFIQESVEQKSGITLLTIHKSKGLEFDSVFLFSEFSGSNPQSNSFNFNYWYKYSEDFTQMTNQLLFLNIHGSTIKNTEKTSKDFTIINRVAELNIHERSKELIAEVNSLYVGLTRAKTCLFHFIYTQSKDLNKIKESRSREYQYKHYLSVIYKILSDSENFDQDLFEYTIGKIPVFKSESDENIHNEELMDMCDIARFVELSGKSEVKQKSVADKKMVDDIKKIVEQRADIYGSLVHDYLSCIRYNTESEIKFAESVSYKAYGNILSQSRFKDLFSQVQEWINENKYYFSQEWDKVFNEYSIFDKSGKEFRIDRLMVNSAKKEICIVDYKTGSISEENQIHNYADIISSLEFVRDNFSVKTEYLKVKLDLQV